MSPVLTTFILDANLLVRLADTQHPHHVSAQSATKALRTSGSVLRTVPQSLFEFWSVATRAATQNGLGLSINEAEKFVDLFAKAYWPIPDDPGTLTYWRRLVVRHNIVGKNTHDARYIASMQAHGLTHFLTFDSDFNRYTIEGIMVVHPDSISSLP